MNNAFHGLRRHAGTASVLIPLVFAGVLIVGALFGWRGLVVQSSSMSPAIDKGALLVTHPVPADQVREGDVVTLADASGRRTTHRVASVTPSPEIAVELVVREDADDSGPSEPYLATEVDRMVVAVPGLGRVVSAVTDPVGILVLAVGLYILVRRRRDRYEAFSATAPTG